MINPIFELPPVRKAVKMWHVRPSRGFLRVWGGGCCCCFCSVFCFGDLGPCHLARGILVPQLWIERRPDRDWEACGRPFSADSDHQRQVL